MTPVLFTGFRCEIEVSDLCDTRRAARIRCQNIFFAELSALKHQMYWVSSVFDSVY